MATAAEVIKAALQKTIVQASEAAFEPDEFADAIFTMNNYMTDLDASGIALGYTVVTTLGDEVTIPVGALRGLIYNLAIETAPEFSGVVTTEVREIARAGLNTMRKLGVSMGDSAFPATLPRGTGHRLQRDDRFYPDLEAEILAETTGSIALETGTEEQISG